MKERKSFLIRIDPVLYQALAEWAAQDLRSLNGQIEYLLKDALIKRKRMKAEEESASTARDNE